MDSNYYHSIEMTCIRNENPYHGITCEMPSKYISYASPRNHQRWVILRMSYRRINALFLFPKMSIRVVSMLQCLVASTSELTHWYAQKTDDNLHRRNGKEDIEYSGLHKPIVSTPGQTKTEDVLED